MRAAGFTCILKKGEIKGDKRWSEGKQACVGFSLVYIASLGDAEMKFDVGDASLFFF